MRAAAFLLPLLLVGDLAAGEDGVWPDPVPLAAVALGIAVVLATVAGSRVPRGLAAPALGLLAGWALLSGWWSDAYGRAFEDVDRLVLYALAAAGSAFLAARVDDVVAGLAMALTGVAALALYGGAVGDLGIPLEDAEAVGPAAALGVLCCLHAGGRAAGALPVLAGALWLSQSRLALAGLVLGVAILGTGARRATVAATLMAGAPGAAAVVLSGALADPVGTRSDPELVVPLVAAVCAALTALGAGRAGALAQRLPGGGRTGVALTAALLLVCIPALAVVPDRPGVVSATLSGSIEGREPVWRAALGAWDDRPLLGTGAGTFPVQWASRRRVDDEVDSASSAVLDTAAELGAVGLALWAAALAVLAVPLARRRREPAAALALALLAAWLPEALTDRAWDVAAVTVVPLVAAGAALGVRRAGAVRLVPAALAGAALVVPVTVALSDRWLDRARDALARGDHAGAVLSAEDARGVRPERPEAYALAAYAYARGGVPAQARRSAALAAERDPDAWTWRYTRAVAEASAGADPRPALGLALQADTRNAFLARMVRRASSPASPDAWRALARRAPALTGDSP